MPRTITARSLVTGSTEVPFPVITCGDDGVITAIESDPRAPANETTTLSATLFDIHFHGACGIDVMTGDAAELNRVRRFLAQHGVAEFLPTTVTAPVDFTLRALERMADMIEASGSGDGQEARPLGIHIEGPFLSHAKRGMHPAACLQPPSIALFERMQQAARGHIRLVTIAPEPDAAQREVQESSFAPNSALELIEHVTAQGVRCSIGHSNATAAEAIAGIRAGAVSATHTFNAMRSLDHREPGILGAVLDDENLYADLICDGVHVAPAAVRLWWKAKGPQRSILITDALAATGMQDGEYVLGESKVLVRGDRALVAEDLRNGKETLAGSVMALDRAVTLFRQFTGASICDAARAASRNPAAMLGLSQGETLQPGDAANFTRWDEEGRLLATYLRGVEVA